MTWRYVFQQIPWRRLTDARSGQVTEARPGQEQRRFLLFRETQVLRFVTSFCWQGPWIVCSALSEHTRARPVRVILRSAYGGVGGSLLPWGESGPRMQLSRSCRDEMNEWSKPTQFGRTQLRPQHGLALLPLGRVLIVRILHCWKILQLGWCVLFPAVLGLIFVLDVRMGTSTCLDCSESLSAALAVTWSRVFQGHGFERGEIIALRNEVALVWAGTL
jgi:hypothetical protein